MDAKDAEHVDVKENIAKVDTLDVNHQLTDEGVDWIYMQKSELSEFILLPSLLSILEALTMTRSLPLPSGRDWFRQIPA